jgi:putative aminopeptidase FrvX
MVKEIDPAAGRLRMSRLGGFAWNSVEGESCSIITASEKIYRGTILPHKASVHVHSGPEVEKAERTDYTMEVRLDAKVRSGVEVRQLGIDVGDFIAFDPRVEVTNNFVRSRHLDDKACVACIVAAIQSMQAAGLKPAQDSTFLISNYEEVGHGASAGFPDNLAELLCVDMAAVGDGQTSDEFHTTLCVKDSGGPYHHGLSQRLRRLAEGENIPFKVDIYPYYGSDGEAYWRAGGNVAVALIGPGVDASHNYERTHLDALVATTQWCLAYLRSK